MTWEIKHPIEAQTRVIGKGFETALELAQQFKVDIRKIDWNQCELHPSTLGNEAPQLWLSASGESPILGEIGLAYICYRFRYIVTQKDMFALYRNRHFDTLSIQLNMAFKKFKERGLHQGGKYFMATLDSELLGLLTSYTSYSHEMILNVIEKTGLASHLSRWVWNPTYMKLFLQARSTVFKDFHYGVIVTNGETGHSALSFHSALWSPNYELSTPIVEKGHSRHLSGTKLIKVVNNMKDALDENKYAYVFDEKLPKFPGTWVTDYLEGLWERVKAREAAIAKTRAVVEHETMFVAGGSALDVVLAIFEAGKSINLSAIHICEQLVEMIVDELASK